MAYKKCRAEVDSVSAGIMRNRLLEAQGHGADSAIDEAEAFDQCISCLRLGSTDPGGYTGCSR